MSFRPDQTNVKDPGRVVGNSTASSKHNEDLLAEIRHRLRKASNIQEELAEAREELLIERERYRTSGKKVYVQRIETGNAEAAFMNALRHFFNSQRDALPPALISAYEKVEAARDELGSIEADHLQIDSKLSGFEWKYTDREGDVYQFELYDLFSNLESSVASRTREVQTPPTLIHPMQDSNNFPDNLDEEFDNANTELNLSRKEFDIVRSERARHIDIQDLPRPPNEEITTPAPSGDQFPPYFGVLRKLMDSEVKVQRLKERLMERDNIVVRRMSEPVDPMQPPHIAFDVITRANSESALNTASENPTTLQRIRYWLLDYLRTNTVQRMAYIEKMKEFGIFEHDGDWEDGLCQYWTIDNNEQLQKPGQNVLPPTQYTSQRPVVDGISRSYANFESGEPSPSESLPIHGFYSDPEHESESSSAFVTKNRSADLLGLYFDNLAYQRPGKKVGTTDTSELLPLQPDQGAVPPDCGQDDANPDSRRWPEGFRLQPPGQAIPQISPGSHRHDSHQELDCPENPTILDHDPCNLEKRSSLGDTVMQHCVTPKSAECIPQGHCEPVTAVPNVYISNLLKSPGKHTLVVDTHQPEPADKVLKNESPQLPGECNTPKVSTLTSPGPRPQAMAHTKVNPSPRRIFGDYLFPGDGLSRTRSAHSARNGIVAVHWDDKVRRPQMAGHVRTRSMSAMLCNRCRDYTSEQLERVPLLAHTSPGL